MVQSSNQKHFPTAGTDIVHKLSLKKQLKMVNSFGLGQEWFTVAVEITGNVSSRRLPLEANVAILRRTNQNDPQEYFVNAKEMPEEQV